LANLVLEVAAGELAPGIDEHEAVVGGEGANVGEAGEEGKPSLERL